MSLHKEIGGYFELETCFGQELHQGALALNTARNCIRYIIRASNIRKIHLPAYTCPVVWEAAEAENCAISFYAIDESFMPVGDLPADDYILYTNYFGVCSENIRNMEKKCNKLIIDNAQSFFAGKAGIASFNSARKFVGVPDGAYLYTDKKLPDDLETDISVNRFAHLLIRADLGANAGYSSFRENDDNLRDEPIKKMSLLTRKILSGLNYDAISGKRLHNFEILHENLGKINELKLVINDDVPMVYPLLIKDDKLRERLIENKIYVATYWNGQRDEKQGAYFQKYLLPIPIDQRYEAEDMSYLVKVIKENIKI